MVSIPYGKDKEGMMYAFLQTISYQFPMGKVKYAQFDTFVY